MLRRAKKSGGGEESGGESVGLWYVSFSDMITLLLSFFVMLTTFSSFSKESLERFSGVWAYVNNYSIFSGRSLPQESVMPQEKFIDRTVEGSEKPPADGGLEPNRRAKAQPWLAGTNQAYADERVFYVPSTRLFWGKGASMMEAGRKHLDLLAKYLRLVPCQVAVGESNPAGLGDVSDRALERSWTVIEYLVGTCGLERDRFSIAHAEESISRSLAGQPIVEITLRTQSVTR